MAVMMRAAVMASAQIFQPSNRSKTKKPEGKGRFFGALPAEALVLFPVAFFGYVSLWSGVRMTVGSRCGLRSVVRVVQLKVMAKSKWTTPGGRVSNEVKERGSANRCGTAASSPPSFSLQDLPVFDAR